MAKNKYLTQLNLQNLHITVLEDK